jgi:hypothetical protein
VKLGRKYDTEHPPVLAWEHQYSPACLEVENTRKFITKANSVRNVYVSVRETNCCTATMFVVKEA